MNPPNLDRVRIAKTATRAGDLLSAAREPGGERLWIGQADFKISTVDFAAAEPRIEEIFTDHTSYVSALAMFGTTLISASWDRTIRWWNVRDRQPVRTVQAHQLWVRQLALHSASNRLASVSDDMTCKLWDATTGRHIRTLTGFDERIPRWDYPNKIFACALSSDGRYVAAADEMCRVLIWETETGREAARFEARGFFKEDWDRNNHPYGGIRCLRFSPDGRSLAIAGMQNSDVAIINGNSLVQIFDWQRGERTYELKPTRDGQYECLEYDPRGGFLVAAIGGGGNSSFKVAFLDLAQPRVAKEVAAPMPTFGFVWGENAASFYTVGRGQALKWEV